MPKVRKESCTSILGTVCSVGEPPEVKAISPGVFEIGANLGMPFFHVHAMRYQKLFCMLIAPPVVNNNRSQCCARLDSDVIVSILSIESFSGRERSGFLV